MYQTAQPVLLKHVKEVMFSCKIEEVALENECDNCTINSPLGILDFPYNSSITWPVEHRWNGKFNCAAQKAPNP